MNIKEYAEQQAKKAREIYTKHYNDSNEIMKEAEQGTRLIGRTTVDLPADVVVGNIENAKITVNSLKLQRDQDIAELTKETNAVIGERMKKAAQEYTEAEPVPSDEDMKRANIIREQYTKNGVITNHSFYDDMEYHIQNETVKAYPFYLVAYSMVPDNDFARKKYLQESITRIFPEITEKAKALEEVTEAQNIFKSALIMNRIEFDNGFSNLESIRMKRELYEMGKIAEIDQSAIITQ